MSNQPSVSLYLSQVLDNIGDAVIVTNLDYRIIRFNKAAEKIYAWRAEDVIGQIVGECIPTEYIDTNPTQVEEQFRSQGVWKGEVIQKTKEGQSRIIASHVVCFTNPEGKDIGIVAINRDVTEQKQQQLSLEHSEAIWRTFANTLPDLAFIFDKDGRYVEILNTRDELLYDDKEQLLNNYVENILPQDVATQFLETIQKTLETHEVQAIEYVLPLEVGETWFEAHTSYFQVDPSLEPMVIWLARNITERRLAEQQRLKLEGLELKFKAEQEISQLRSKLLTTISHEFRTPLAVIQTGTHILQQYRDKLTLDKQTQRLNLIHQQVTHIKEMLDDISQTIEIMNQEFRIEPSVIELESFFRELINSIEKDTNRVKFQTPIQNIYADPWILKVILSNLLSNALRYSPNDSTIYCSINTQKHYLEIQVSDSGIGIPESEIGHIFEPHYRASNTGGIRGIGLGLSLVKNFVSKLDGEISVESKVDEGSTFTVKLPHITFDR